MVTIDFFNNLSTENWLLVLLKDGTPQHGIMFSQDVADMSNDFISLFESKAPYVYHVNGPMAVKLSIDMGGNLIATYDGTMHVKKNLTDAQKVFLKIQ